MNCRLVVGVIALFLPGPIASQHFAVVDPSTSSTVAGRMAPPVADAVLPSGATAEQLVAALAAIPGPTTDLAGELDPLLAAPTGLPTPVGASVNGWAVYHEGDRWSAQITAEASGPSDTIAAAYLAALPPVGLPVVSDTTSTDFGDAPVRTLVFDGSATGLAGSQISLAIVDSEPLSLSLAFAVPTTPDSTAVLAGWYGALPLPPGGVVRTVSTNTAKVNDVIGVAVSAAVEVPGPLTEVEAAVLAGLPGTAYAVDSEMVAYEHELYLVGPGPIASVALSFFEGATADTTEVWISGSFDLN